MSQFQNLLRGLGTLTERIPIRMIDRYVIRQFFLSYFMCASVILGLFVVLEGLSHLDKFTKQDRALVVVLFHYFCATIPIYFSQFLGPVFTLMAGLFTVTILNKNNEIVPLRAAGISVGRILAPILVCAGVMGALMIVVQEAIIPVFKDEIRVANSYSERKSDISPDKVVDSNGNIIDVQTYTPHDKVGNYVQVTTRHDDGKPKKIMRSRLIRWHEDGEGYWELIDVDIQEFDENFVLRPINPRGEGKEKWRIREESHPLATDMRPVDLESSDRDIPFLTWRELSMQYQRRPHLTHLRVKIHRRVAFPLSNVILLLLGFPFVVKGLNRSIIVGVGAAIVIAAAYLFVDTVCADLGNKGDLPPVLAAWLPVLFFGALGYTMFVDIENN